MVYKLQIIYSSSSLRHSSLSDAKAGTVQFFDLLQISNAATAPDRLSRLMADLQYYYCSSRGYSAYCNYNSIYRMFRVMSLYHHHHHHIRTLKLFSASHIHHHQQRQLLLVTCACTSRSLSTTGKVGNRKTC